MSSCDAFGSPESIGYEEEDYGGHASLGYPFHRGHDLYHRDDDRNIHGHGGNPLSPRNGRRGPLGKCHVHDDDGVPCTLQVLERGAYQ